MIRVRGGVVRVSKTRHLHIVHPTDRDARPLLEAAPARYTHVRSTVGLESDATL